MLEMLKFTVQDKEPLARYKSPNRFGRVIFQLENPPDWIADEPADPFWVSKFHELWVTCYSFSINVGSAKPECKLAACVEMFGIN